MRFPGSILILLGLVAAGCAGEDRKDAATGEEAAETAAVSSNHGVAAPVQQPAARSVVPPDDAVRLKRVEIVDRNGFEKPMTATTVLVPAGWRTQGGIVWNVQATCGAGYNVDFRADAPDGVSALHFFPSEYWEWNTMGAPSRPGCVMAQIGSAQQYLENLVGRTRPGARIVDYRRREDIEQQFSQMNSVTPMPMGESRLWVEAGEAIIEYREGGADLREVVVVAIVFNRNIMHSMDGMPSMDFLSASTLPGFSMRAPKSEFDSRLAEVIRASSRENPRWSARINRHNANINKINVEGARQRSRIIAETGEEIRQMQQDGWRQRNETNDRIHRETTEAIRGVETYDDPYYGGTVELDNTYERAFQLDDGTYVLTDDPSFEPYAVYGMDGQELTPTE